MKTQTRAAGGQRAKETLLSLRHNKKFGLILILLVEIILVSAMEPVFLTSGNLINVLRQISVNGIMAVGMTFVILTGGIDISAGIMISVSGVIAGSVLAKWPDMWLGAVLAALGVCAVFGAINGVLVGVFDLPRPLAEALRCCIRRGGPFPLPRRNSWPWERGASE